MNFKFLVFIIEYLNTILATYTSLRVPLQAVALHCQSTAEALGVKTTFCASSKL